MSDGPKKKKNAKLFDNIIGYDEQYETELTERLAQKNPEESVPDLQVENSYDHVGVLFPPVHKFERPFRRPRMLFVQPDEKAQHVHEQATLFQRRAGGGRNTIITPDDTDPLRGSTVLENEELDPLVDGHHAHLDPNVLYDFSDIVDADATEAYEDYVSEVLCGKLVEGSIFRFTVLIAILLNTILVGMQTSASLEREHSALMQACDKVFIAVFTLEILLKWFHGFWAFWKVGWNIFDFALVFISIVGDGLEFLRTGRVLRIFRVLRAFRSLRSISALKGLQMVVSTIVRSFPDMLNILALLMIVMFIFAVIGVDLFSKKVPQHFGSISTSMFTLFVYMTEDGWVDVYKDIDAEGAALMGAIFSVVYILIGALIFANIIVGVTVTNLQVSYAEMKAERIVKHRMLGEVNVRFKRDSNSMFETVDTADVKPSVYQKQVSLLMPDARRLNEESIDHYFAVMVAIDANMSEHLQIKEELNAVLKEVQDYQREVDDIMGEESSEEYSDFSSDEDYPLFGRADALTRTMNIQRRQEMRTRRIQERSARVMRRKQLRRQAGATTVNPDADQKDGYEELKRDVLATMQQGTVVMPLVNDSDEKAGGRLGGGDSGPVSVTDPGWDGEQDLGMGTIVEPASAGADSGRSDQDYDFVSPRIAL